MRLVVASPPKPGGLYAPRYLPLLLSQEASMRLIVPSSSKPGGLYAPHCSLSPKPGGLYAPHTLSFLLSQEASMRLILFSPPKPGGLYAPHITNIHHLGIPQGVNLLIYTTWVYLRVYLSLYASLLYILGFRTFLSKEASTLGITGNNLGKREGS